MDSLLTTLSNNRLMILFYLFLGFLFGFLYRRIVKQLFSKSVRGKSKNIDTSGRRSRGLAGMFLLYWAVRTGLSPWLLFFAGFCFFEALFSRCGFYAAIGKNSCPLE